MQLQQWSKRNAEVLDFACRITVSTTAVTLCKPEVCGYDDGDTELLGAGIEC